MEKDKKYYLGLDIGTDSIGWAVTDTDYKVLRHNNKPMWGVHLFNQAQTAAVRRANRTARRRLERRKQRLALLQGLFAEAIEPIDSSFFVRLDESNLYQEDKRSRQRFSLFADKNFNDATFHRTYHTVYHLRAAMLDAVDPDPRLVYLAIHHIVKYRGHFLLEGDELSSTEDITAPLEAINQWLAEKEDEQDTPLPTLRIDNVDAIKAALCLPTLSARKERLKEVFGVEDNSLKSLVDIIAGGKVPAVRVKAFHLNKEDNISISLEADKDAVEAELREKLGDDYIVIENAWLLYDYGRLHRLLGDHKYISQGMIEKYAKHKKDLALLRAVYRQYFTPEQYKEMFAAPPDGKCNYTVYSGKYDYGRRGTPPLEVSKESRKNRTKEDFYKFVKAELNANEAAMKDPRVLAILQDIEDGAFMPKQVSKANAVLPYQCNLAELRAILDNVCRYPRYAFLLRVDDDGIRVRDKIESLVSFRMPYYVGPINNHSGKYWVVRHADGKIYPWNLQQMIDLAASEQNFTQRMTKDCPYIPGAKVLPKCSLLYEEASMLNLINVIRIDGTLLAVDVKNRLSAYLATPQDGRSIGKLTKAGLKKWLVSQGVLSSSEAQQVTITGMDDEIPNGRRTWAAMHKLLGSAQAVQDNLAHLELFILWATICGPDKTNLRKRITAYCKDNGNIFDADQIKAFAGLTFKGWGRYSKQLLLDRYGTDMDTGEVQCVSLLQMLRSTNCNISELLNSEQYGFAQSLRQLNPAPEGNVDYDDIDALYCSPAVKKQIWQVIRLVNEIKQVLPEPVKVFVEMARDDAEEAKKKKGKRTIERKAQISKALDALYKDKQRIVAQNEVNVRGQFDALDAKSLQSNKLYLYFMQNGLDAYTGEPIDYNNLAAYDRDHIYPRSKIKDDSLLNNLVLTYSLQNKKKTDVYPISPEVQTRMRPIWQQWLKAGLITKEKFNRLTRTTPLTEQECADFINRQLVETRQSTKEVCRLLKQIFPDTEIVYSRASLVSDFRQGVAYDYQNEHEIYHPFVKVRDINDLHHAKDAYLNIVVGNVFNTKFGHNAEVYFKTHNVDHFALSRLYTKDIGGAWGGGAQGTMQQVIRTMGTNAMLFTRESYRAHGILNKVTILSKAEATIPVKQGAQGKRAIMADTAKYGGYSDEVRNYYMLVQHTKTKGKKQSVCYTFVGVRGRYAQSLTDDAARVRYCLQQGYQQPIVLLNAIKIDSMFAFDGLLLTLSGATGARIVWKLGVQMGFDLATESYLKKLYNVVEKQQKLDKSKQQYTLDQYDGITESQNLAIYDNLTMRLSAEPYSAVSAMRTYAKNLTEKRNAFIALPPLQQCLVLAQILRIVKCDAQMSDLSALGLSPNSGRILLPSTFDSLDGIVMVHRSITGIFEQKIPLCTLPAHKQ